MNEAALSTLRYEVSDAIATVTLDRPEKLNAFNSTMMGELLDLFDRIDRDDAIRVVIVTGTGRVFCSGADLDEGFGAGGGEGADFRDRGGRIALRIRDCLKPVIGVVNGAAAGVGAAMLLAMDLRVGTPATRFVFPYTRIGLVPEGCASWFLPRLVGPARAMQWILWGATVGAEEASETGLVSAVLPVDEAMAYTRARAAEIVQATAPVAVAVARQMMWAGQCAADPAQTHLVESRIVAQRRVSADVIEGIAAFREKRPPAFPQRVSDGLPAQSAGLNTVSPCPHIMRK